jgi:ABC-type antimicrobial peptide transport system permease subunit
MIRKVERIWKSIVGVIGFLLFVSCGISVLNIVFMLVAERTVEIGTLMAIGAKGRDIRRLFTLEAVLIGGLGGLAGAIAGNAVVLAMAIVGVPFDSPFSTDDIVVHPKMSLLVTVAVALVAVVICYVSALVPARRASRVEPVVAFRGQVT